MFFAENMAYGAKSTEFMAPPNFAFRLLREAALRLAVLDPAVRSLINPRQSLPVAYEGSPLNHGDTQAWSGGPAPGTAAPDAMLHPHGLLRHLSQAFGDGFVLLYFSAAAQPPAELAALRREGPLPVHLLALKPSTAGQAWARFDADEGTLYIVRPDAYVLGRWRKPTPDLIRRALGAAGVR